VFGWVILGIFVAFNIVWIIFRIVVSKVKDEEFL
jgi:hypothetical protein